MLDPENNDQDLFAEDTSSAPNPGQEAEGSTGPDATAAPDVPSVDADQPAVKAPAKRASRSTAKKSTPRKAAAKKAAAPDADPADAALDLSAAETDRSAPTDQSGPTDQAGESAPAAKKAAPRKRTTKRAASRPAGPAVPVDAPDDHDAAAASVPPVAAAAETAHAAAADEPTDAPVAPAPEVPSASPEEPSAGADDAPTGSGAPMVVFQAPAKKTARKRAVRKSAPAAPAPLDETDGTDDESRVTSTPDDQDLTADRRGTEGSEAQDAATEESSNDGSGSKKSGSAKSEGKSEGKSGGKKSGGKKGGGKKKKAESATDADDSSLAADASRASLTSTASVGDDEEDEDASEALDATVDGGGSDATDGADADRADDEAGAADSSDSDEDDESDESSDSAGERELGEGNPRRRRRRGGRRRRKPADRASDDGDASDRDTDGPGESGQDDTDGEAADGNGSEDADETGGGTRSGGRGRSSRGGGRGRDGGSQTGEQTGERAGGRSGDAEGADRTDDGPGDAEDANGDAGSDDDAQDGRRRSQGGRRGSGRSGSRDGDRTDDEASGDSREADAGSGDSSDEDDEGSGEGGSSGSRRRRRRRRSGDGSGGSQGGQQGEDRGDGEGRGRRRNPEDEITSVQGSTRLEAKKQRRREGREAGRRRAPIVSEAEFLARREAVDRVMVVRQRRDLTQIAVLEDKVLVEHYVARESQTSLIGNVYLGRVQNVLPSMEAAFVDIGKGRNAVIYAGEVNWQALGHKEGQPRKIESVLSSGQTILVQVTKDPIGHKGARLTGQISLPGRFLVLVPEGTSSGISRKLPDTERSRLKKLLKEILPEGQGVIVRTAAEGASEEELTTDVERLTARWQDIEAKVAAGKGPQLLYGEPDLTLKVVRDLFTEDFAKLVIQGDDAWNLVDGYVSHVAPELRDRLEHYGAAEEGQSGGNDVFAAYRVDEQIAKGLDRKVWLPSGGSLVIDRTEAMTVVDVNTGKFTGSGGNLEETVTKNNLEAAEEIVRQLRLRDIGGIIVVDFIDMVLESNRDLVLRRLVECLGRDRTRHQVAEVTSLGLVQMTRKRIGTGLLESFSHDCEHCRGRGVVVEAEPVDPHQQGQQSDDDGSRGGRNRGGRNRGGRPGGNGSGGNGSGGNGSGGGGNGSGGNGGSASPAPGVPSPAALAHSRPPEKTADRTESTDPSTSSDPVDPSGSTETVAHQDVIGRPTPAIPEPQDVPSESGTPAPAASSAEADPVAPAPQVPTPSTTEADVPVPTEQPGEAAVPTAEVAPAPPAVRTTTRRRSARRPAGPPVQLASLDQDAPMPGAGTKAGPDSEPVAVPVEPAVAAAAPDVQQEAQPDVEAAKGADAEAAPLVDATVAADLEDTAVTVDGAEGVEGAVAADESEAGPETQVEEVVDENGVTSLVHVPVKRKGARKR